MRFKNRKTPVFVLLGLLLTLQIVFSGIRRSEDKNTVSATDLNLAEVSAENSAVQNDEPITEEEVVCADLNVVYRSNLTSAEVDDEFESSIDNGDFDNKILSFSSERLCVYEKANLSSAVVGVMYSGSEADIIKKGKVWSLIKSGSVEGYVRNTDVLFGDEAQIIAESVGKKMAKAVNGDVDVYTEASSGATALTKIAKGEDIRVCESYGDWSMVSTSVGYGYVKNSEVDCSYGLTKAITIEEEKQKQAEEAAAAAKRAAEEAAAAAAQAAKDKYSDVSSSNRSAFPASEEEIHLLASIIYWEAGWEPDDGKLAVANVVLNRVLSSEFSQNTIQSVIYAPGQFTGVAEGGEPTERFRSVLAMSNEELDNRGCYTAALRALAGENNIGDYLFFISVHKADYNRYERYMVINNHCFYLY